MKLFLLFVAAFLLVPVAARADECVKEWTFKTDQTKVLAISACKYSSGRSGFYKVENLKNYPVRVCWEIEFANLPKPNKFCGTFKAAEIRKGSCFSCSPVNGGAKNITVTKYEKR